MVSTPSCNPLPGEDTPLDEMSSYKPGSGASVEPTAVNVPEICAPEPVAAIPQKLPRAVARFLPHIAPGLKETLTPRRRVK